MNKYPYGFSPPKSRYRTKPPPDRAAAAGDLGLQRAGIPTKSAEELLARMLAKVDDLCAQRDKLVGEERRKYPGTNKGDNGTTERQFK